MTSAEPRSRAAPVSERVSGPATSAIRVLFLHHYAPFVGASRSLLELIESFPPGAVVPRVATPAGPFAAMLERRHVEVEALRGVALFDHTRYSHYRGLRWLVLLREILTLPLTARGMRRTHERWPDVDVIHVNEATMLPSVWLARKRWRKPVVLHVRSVMHAWDGWRGRAIRRFLERHVARVIAIDENVAHSLPGTPPVTVIHNGLTPPAPEVVAAPLAPRPFTVGMVGSLLKVKGCREFVEAARILRDEGVEARFVFYGQSARRTGGVVQAFLRLAGLSQEVEPALRDYVARHRLGDRVEFRGFTDDLAFAYRSLDVVCFPSHYDAPGRPIFEAAFFGVPAIAAVSAPRRDTVRPGETGLVVRPRDATGLARAIRTYAGDPELRARHGCEARRLAASLFVASDNADAVLSIYEGVVRRDGNGPAGES